MSRGDLEKRVASLESQITRPQQPVETIFVDEFNYTEKEVGIQQAEKEGRHLIAIHCISGRLSDEPKGGYAEYLSKRGYAKYLRKRQ